LKPTPSAETMLLRLAGLPPGPDVTVQYSQLAECLGAINRGEIFATWCDAPTPALASVVEASVQPDEARVVWYLPLGQGMQVTAERSGELAEWRPIAPLPVDGSGLATLVDRDVHIGARYGYRVSYPSGGQTVRAGEVWLEVPSIATTMLTGVLPNPTTGDRFAVRFSLATRGAASLEIFDVGGRRLVHREVGSLGPGAHTLDLATGRRLAAGIYVVRLKAAGVDLTRKAVVME